MDSYSDSNLQYFLGKKLFVDIACQIIVEKIKFEMDSYGLLDEKDPATRHVLKTKPSFKRQIACCNPLVIKF